VRLALESLHWPFKTTLGLGFLIFKDYIVHYSYLLYCVGLELNLWYLWGMWVLQQSNSHEFFGFLVHIKVMFTWHWSLLMCINIVSKKIRTLILKYFIAKNDNHDQPLVHYNILPVEGLGSYWWLLTDQGGGCWRLGWLWQFLKIRQWWQLPHWLTPPLRNNFSVSCSDVWWHFTHSRASSKIWINPLKPYHCFISQVHVMFYFLFLLPFRHSSQHLHKELTSCQEITFFAHLSEAMPHPLKFYHEILLGLPGSPVGKESACNAGDQGSIPGWGRSPGEGNGSPLQYSLENPMDRGAWQATVHGVTKSWTQLSDYTTTMRFQQLSLILRLHV